VSQFNLTALGACTSLTLCHYFGVLMAPNNSGVVGSNVELKAQPALTGGTLTTGWKTYDSGWLSCGSGLVTDISAYGVTIGSPVHRFDTVGGNPTIGRCAVGVGVERRAFGRLLTQPHNDCHVAKRPRVSLHSRHQRGVFGFGKHLHFGLSSVVPSFSVDHLHQRLACLAEVPIELAAVDAGLAKRGQGARRAVLNTLLQGRELLAAGFPPRIKILHAPHSTRCARPQGRARPLSATTLWSASSRRSSNGDRSPQRTSARWAKLSPNRARGGARVMCPRS
jgi:hypothetical protein